LKVLKKIGVAWDKRCLKCNAVVVSEILLDEETFEIFHRCTNCKEILEKQQEWKYDKEIMEMLRKRGFCSECD